MAQHELKQARGRACHKRWERRRRRRPRDKQRAGKSSPADFVFQIKAPATSGDKDVSDRMRKWNVYSEREWGVGGADKAGHTRRSSAPVQTVTVCYSYEQRHFLRRAVWNGELGAPHFLTYPIWQFHFSKELSDKLFVFVCVFKIYWNTQFLFSLQTFHVCTNFTGTQWCHV